MPDHRRSIAWQGWTLQLPRRWDAVKLEGDFDQGHALFADSLRPRLGIRWQKLRKNADPSAAVTRALRAEVGQLAADEAMSLPDSDDAWLASKLYIEPNPPGRDVFCTFSITSGRLLQIVYHAQHRENALAAAILPTLADLPLERAARWSIFDLNCIIPGGLSLQTHRLNAGDLALTFADHRCQLTIRQIAIAQLALQRQSLDAWILDTQKLTRKHHHPTGLFSDTSICIRNEELPARLSRMTRRWRFALMSPFRQFTTIGIHDKPRDRLILLHGTDPSLLQVIAPSVGIL